MRRYIGLLIGCVLVLLSVVAFFHWEEDERYVVVLSMDGFRSDYPEKAYTPTLDSLAKVGVRAAFRPSFPSLTFPNHYSMATGLHPDHHGLISNTFYATDLDSVYRQADPTPAFYGGEPIWNTAEKQGIRSATFFWIGSEYKIQGRQPSIWKAYDSSIPNINRADSVIAWLQLPEEQRPHLIMWYMEEPDAIGHTCTPDSSATIEKVEELDRVLNHFFTEARQLDIFDKIDFLVLSDHGMATCEAEREVNLNDYLPRDSFEHIFEGVPTLLYPKEGYTETAYQVLKQIPDITVWKKEEIPAKYIYGSHPRVSDLVVLPDMGVNVCFRDEPYLFGGGMHGFDNFSPEMEAIFYAAGPSFKQHVSLPVMANVNLYLIISRLLQIEPAPNDGSDVEIEALFR